MTQEQGLVIERREAVTADRAGLFVSTISTACTINERRTASKEGAASFRVRGILARLGISLSSSSRRARQQQRRNVRETRSHPIIIIVIRWLGAYFRLKYIIRILPHRIRPADANSMIMRSMLVHCPQNKQKGGAAARRARLDFTSRATAPRQSVDLVALFQGERRRRRRDTVH
jgi:hypothetical protein